MDGLSIRMTDGSPPVLQVAGELDLATAGHLSATLERALSAHATLIVDLADVTFVDAAGLHAILRVAECRNGEGPLTLVNAPRLARLLKVVGLEELPSIDVRDGDAGRVG